MVAGEKVWMWLETSDFNESMLPRARLSTLHYYHLAKSCLLLHSKRANIIAKIWRAGDLRTIELPDRTRHGWSADFEIQWMSDESFPENIKTILMEPSLDGLDDILGEDEDCVNDSEDE